MPRPIQVVPEISQARPRARKLTKLNRDLHRLNILATHRWLQQQT
jgi:hypothetical protein